MDSPNFWVPAWSMYTLPHRGKLVLLQLSFAEILAGQYRLLDHQRRQRRLDSGDQLTGADGESSSESESDRDYTLPGGGSPDYSAGPHEYHLRPRPPHVPLADITPIPEIVTAVDLDKLGPRIFVDLDDRVGAVFLGPPVKRTAWEHTIRSANKSMRVASAHLDRARLATDGIRSGITYDTALKRPRSIERAENHNLTNMVVLAALRYSHAIQDITSFQNAAFQQIAPRAWSDARQAIDAVHRDSRPPPAFRAITALGNYPYHEGKLVLWQHRKIIDFPPGSTFLFPAGFVSYSFTAVETPSWQMLITQSCSAGLHGFVRNGFDDRYAPDPWFPTRAAQKANQMSRAKKAAALYPTVAEFDAYQAKN
ncbi:hypothetical protein B0H11DRAFT_1920223 [Mycena galericulata]|nr:hypothetical protein B0H11DRAFT_1920223 [Mycena galericulata]